MLDPDLAEPRIDRRDVGLQPLHHALGIDLPGGRVSRPQQAVATDDPVMTVGEVRVGHRAAVGDRLGEARPERRGGEHIRPDRHQRAGHPRHQRAEMDVAGEHM
jgi:hypothetical protein